MNLFATIGNDADDDFLPAVFTPHSRFRAGTKVGDVPHHTVHRPGEAVFVFVVHRDANKQLRFSPCRIDILPQQIPPLHEIIRITRNRGIPHMRKLLLISPRQERMQNTRYLTIQNQLSVNQLHLFPCHHRLPIKSAPLLPIHRRGSKMLPLCFNCRARKLRNLLLVMVPGCTRHCLLAINCRWAIWSSPIPIPSPLAEVATPRHPIFRFIKI